MTQIEGSSWEIAEFEQEDAAPEGDPEHDCTGEDPDGE